MATNIPIVTGYPTPDKIKEVAATLNMSDVEAEVHLTRQEQFLLQTIFGTHAKRVRSRSAETYEWYTEGHIPLADKITADATITLPAAAGGAVPAFLLQVENPDYYEKHQVIYVNSDQLGYNGNKLELFVQNVSMAGLEVKLTNAPAAGGGTTDITLTADTPVIMAGVAKSALDWSGDGKTVVPVKSTNYMQNFMGEAFMSEHQERTLKEAKWGMRNCRRQSLLRFKIRKEVSYLLGSGRKIADDLANNDKQLCIGLANFDISRYVTPAVWSEDDYQLFFDQCFRAQDSSDTKFLLAGREFLRKLNTYTESRVKRTREASSRVTALDMNWDEVSVLGYRLLCKRYRILDEAGLSNTAVVIDPDHIGQADFIPLRTEDKTIKERKATGINGFSVLTNEVSTPVVYFPQTHCVFNL